MNNILTRLKNLLVTYWVPVRDVLGAIVGFVLLRRYLQYDLKAQLKTEETKAQDQAIEVKKTALVTEINSLEDANKKADSDLTKKEDDLKNATDQQVVDYYNKPQS